MSRRVGYTLLILALCLVSLLPVPSLRATPPAEAGPSPLGTDLDCNLLDDPDVRARMSAAFELALLQECGRFTPGPVFPTGDPVPAGVQQLGPDVRVNAADPPAFSTTQSETSIALNANTGTICSSWNDSYHYLVQGFSYCGFARSTDGGATFQDGGYMPPGGGGRARGDPSMAWRAADGHFYFTCIQTDNSGLGMWRSTDDCATFQWLSMPHSGSGDDKEFMTIDNNPASPYYGRLYVAWTDFSFGRIRLVYSDDGSAWSSPVDLSSPGASVQGAWPAVAPNGDVYVTWVRWQSSNIMDMEVVRSTNGGTSFSFVNDPASGLTVPRDAAATSACGRAALNGNIRYLPSPQIVVGPDGCLHVVYPYDPDGYNVGDVVNSYYRRSCDNGVTWGPEILLNDDGGLTDQFFPNVAVNENNAVAASWYDRRLDPGSNYLFDRYVAVSYDGGTTWEPNERVSDVSSPVYIDPSMSTCYHGDYDQLAADAGSVYVEWSDDRVFFNGHYDPDVWFERVPLQCDPVQGADFAWEPFLPTATLPVTFTAWAYGNRSWFTDTVDNTGDVGVFTSLVVDAADRPHISYYDWASGDLRHAYYDGGTWISETVDSSGDTGWYSSIAMDAADRPHISYMDLSNLDLNYAYHNGTDWITETVDSTGTVGRFSSLALDAQERPHISYMDYSGYDLKYAYYDGTAWISETVDSYGDVGFYTSLALDAAGRPHISYSAYDLSDFDHNLKYAYHDGNTWQSETVDSVGDVGTFTSLALDAAGRPHISYIDYDNTALKFAHYDSGSSREAEPGGAWRIETVDSSGDVGKQTSLALNPAGRPYISYCQYDPGSWACQDLKIAHYDGSGWSIEVVDSAGDVGDDSSLALDAAGLPHVSYSGFSTGKLHYAGLASTPPTLPIYYNWDLGDSTLASGEIVSHSYSLPGEYTVVLAVTNCATATATISQTVTVAPCGSVQGADFSWTPVAPTVSETAFFTASAWAVDLVWITETADPRGGNYASLDLDAVDYPHISSYYWGSGDLIYTHYDGASWLTETVDSAGDVGRYSSLALDSAGRPHISYASYDSGTGQYDLKYAYHDGSNWQIEIVDSDESTGRWASLTLDAADRPHISYYDLTARSLNYAYYDGAAWQIETVDGGLGYGGGYGTLALDTSGHPHVSYCDNVNRTLNYAFHDGSAWITETVEVNVGGFAISSLALDAAGRPHISYLGSDRLKHAWYDGATWHNEIVDPAGHTGNSNSLAVDARNHLHVSYYESDNQDLRYAYYDTNTWRIETVDRGGYAGVYTSLALDTAGRPHIGYSASGLRYARLSPTLVSPFPPITYTWALGEGTLAEGEVISHSYNLAGSYVVVLTATNCQGGGVATATHTITVLGPCDPVTATSFAWIPLTPTAGQAVTLSASASGTVPITYSWALGDGNWGAGVSITHFYTAPGVFNVTLTATNGCGQEVVSDTVTVLPACDPVTATTFSWTPLTPTAGQMVTFTGSASGTEPISYSWDLGVGRLGIGVTVTHVYTVAGTYTVTLTTTNACGEGTLERRLTVVPATPTEWRIYLPVVWRSNGR